MYSQVPARVGAPKLEIHGRTWPCSSRSRATCLCALIIKYRNDYIRASICHGLNVSPSYYRSSPRIRMQMLWGAAHHSHMSLKVNSGGLSDEVKVMHDHHRNQAVITFASGEVVEVSKAGISMTARVTVPPVSSHASIVGGLCGVPWPGSSVFANSVPNALHDSTCRWGRRRRCRDILYNLGWWLADKTLSLFHQQPISEHKPNKTDLCGCYDDITRATQAINCGKDGNQQPDAKSLTCRSCVDVSSQLPTDLFAALGKRDAGDAGGADFDVFEYLKEVPGAKRGEAQTANRSDELVTSAKELCNVTLSQCVLLPHCGNNTEAVLEDVMEECVGDVLESDDPEFARTALMTLDLLCKEEIRRDPSNYRETKDGNLEIIPELSTELCDQVCYEHGQCVKGKCLCNQGYQGTQCDKLADHVSLYSPISTGVVQHSTDSVICDIAKEGCKSIRFTYDQKVTSARCEIHTVAKINSYKAQSKIASDREFLCYIPSVFVGRERQGSPHENLTISVWVNSQASSQHTVNYFIYDSSCTTFDVTGTLRISRDVCIIDNSCYPSGAKNAASDDEGCVPDVSTRKWSPLITSPVLPEDAELTLTIPDLRQVVCHVTSSTNEQEVSWYLNNVLYTQLTLAPGQTEAVLDINEVKKDRPVKLQCRSTDSNNVIRVSQEGTFV